MSDDSKANAEIRAKLTEEVRKVVREEIQDTKSRLESIDKNVGDLREKVASASTYLKILTGLCVAIVVAIVSAALRVKFVVLNDPPASASATAEPTGRLNYAALRPDASWVEYAKLMGDGGTGRLPAIVPNEVGRRCATSCKDSLAPPNCATECMKNRCWQWCLSLAIAANDERLECVTDCFQASAASKPMRTFLDLPFDLRFPDASPEDLRELPEEPPDGSPLDAGRDK